MSPKKIVLVLATIALVVFLGLALWPPGDGAKESTYIAAPVTKGDITQVVSATGTMQAVITVQVGSQVSGTITKLSADFNSRVKKDQIIAELDPAKFKARVDEAKANLLTAQASLAKMKVAFEDSRRTLARAKELRERELISQSDLDAAQTAFDAAAAQMEVSKAQVAQADAGLNQANVDLTNTVIRSPVDGIVISRNVDVGQTVAASLQAPTLFTIANDLTKMEVHTNVAEADIGNVWPGQEVTFTVDAYPLRRFRGQVSQVRNAPMVVQNVVTYDAVVGINNRELLLKPGMTANVDFLVSQKSDILRIPNAALRFRPPSEKRDPQDIVRQAGRSGPGGGEGRRGGGSAGRRPLGGDRGGGKEGSAGGDGRGERWARIYLLKDGDASQLRVRLGITDGTYTEVSDGEVREGQQVVLALSEKAKSNSRSAFSDMFRVRGFGWFR